MEAARSKAEQSERTRGRLVASATKLFARKGYRDASVQEIAEAARISRGSIFWHFGSKEGLLWAVAEELFAQWENEVLVPEVGEATGIAAVRRSLDAHHAFLTGNTDAIRLYERLGFEARGVRRGYYTDNREDAVIMWRDAGPSSASEEGLDRGVTGAA